MASQEISVKERQQVSCGEAAKRKDEMFGKQKKEAHRAV